MAFKDVFLGKQTVTAVDSTIFPPFILTLGNVSAGFRALTDKLAVNDLVILKLQDAVTKQWQVSYFCLKQGGEYSGYYLVNNDVWTGAPIDSSNAGNYITLNNGGSYLVESVAYPAKLLPDANGNIELNGKLVGGIIGVSNQLGHSTANNGISCVFDNGRIQHDKNDTGTLDVLLDDQNPNMIGKCHVINPVGAGNVSLTVDIVGKTLTWLPSGTTGNRTIQAGGYAEIIKDYDGNFIIVNGVGVV
jgi:hypothetical protein